MAHHTAPEQATKRKRKKGVTKIDQTVTAPVNSETGLVLHVKQGTTPPPPHTTQDLNHKQ